MKFRDAMPDEVWVDTDGREWRVLHQESDASEVGVIGAGGVVAYFDRNGNLALLNGERRDFGVRMQGRIV